MAVPIWVRATAESWGRRHTSYVDRAAKFGSGPSNQIRQRYLLKIITTNPNWPDGRNQKKNDVYRNVLIEIK